MSACAESFWGYWSSHSLIFRDNGGLKPSIHIHVDLHAHTRFAVDAVAGSESEGLHCSAQAPLLLSGIQIPQANTDVRCGSGKTWLLRGLTRLGASWASEISDKHFNQNMVRQSLGSGFQASTMGEPKDNECLTELSSKTLTVKIHPGRPRDVCDVQPHCRENGIYDIRCVFDS